MNRILSLSLSVSILSLFALLLFFTLALVACVPSTCASDSDCAVDSVCLVDADGPHCTAISLPVRGATVEDVTVEVEFVDDEVGSDIDSDIDSGIVLRDASTSFAPDARAGSIVMRPITVIVTRSPSTTSPNTTRSNP